MFKKFWEQSKDQLQFVGILIGVGALFLSIPVPEVEKAAEALHKIQIVWLMIVTISSMLLFVKLYTLSRLYELNSTKDIDGFNFDETISTIIGVTIAYFVINMWIYASSLYQEAFSDFANIARFGVSALLASITYYCWRKIILKFENSNPKIRISIAMIGHMVNALILGAWFNFSINNWQFILTEWLYWSAGTFVAMMILFTLADWKRSKETARDTIKPESENL
jgi:hypothetical protein